MSKRLRRKHRVEMASFPSGETPALRRSWKRSANKSRRDVDRVMIREGIE